jgi:hypothetical protein
VVVSVVVPVMVVTEVVSIIPSMAERGLTGSNDNGVGRNGGNLDNCLNLGTNSNELSLNCRESSLSLGDFLDRLGRRSRLDCLGAEDGSGNKGGRMTNAGAGGNGDSDDIGVRDAHFLGSSGDRDGLGSGDEADGGRAGDKGVETGICLADIVDVCLCEDGLRAGADGVGLSHEAGSNCLSAGATDILD